MPNIPKLLITIGIVLIIVGALWQIGGKFISLGKLPGDIFVKKVIQLFTFLLLLQ